MGGRDKVEGAFITESEEEEELAMPGAAFPEASDDEEDEGNEDLSLKIVEKAISMRAAKMASALRDEDALDGESDEDALDGDVAGSLSLGRDVAAASSEGNKKVESGEWSELSSISPIDEDACEAVQPVETVESVDLSSVEITDNAVMRKLLRGPRYFDPQDCSLGTCYNCGGEGHLAVNCTSEKRKKPCFICGSLEHGVKQCKKAQNCFICKKGGHLVKDCPEKQKSLNGKMCLKCGESGHDMFICASNYPTDDLKVIRCYICQEFGHLCCLDPVDPDPAEASCYRCGELGHTGLACENSHERTAGEATPSTCFRCGEEGHFARECRNSSKARATNSSVLANEFSPRRCHRCGGEGHFARGCRISGLSDTRTPIGNFWEKVHFSHERSSKLALSRSSCYNCNEGGHFALECMSSSKAHASGSIRPVNGVIASLCYKCGEGGHFARECRKSNQTFVQMPAFCKRCGKVGHSADENKCSTKIVTPTLCYNCGESGHFTRECRNFSKGVEREHELSTPSSKRHKDHGGSKSMPNGDVKSCKRKKPEKPDSRPTTPYKPKHRGGWITEDPVDWSSGNYEKAQMSPWTKVNSTPKYGALARPLDILRGRSRDTGNVGRRGNHSPW